METNLQTFAFQCPLNELASKTLDVAVFDKDVAKADDFIGSFFLLFLTTITTITVFPGAGGIEVGSASKGELARHWLMALENPGREVERWHKLKPSPIPSLCKAK